MGIIACMLPNGIILYIDPMGILSCTPPIGIIACMLPNRIILYINPMGILACMSPMGIIACMLPNGIILYIDPMGIIACMLPNRIILYIHPMGILSYTSPMESYYISIQWGYYHTRLQWNHLIYPSNGDTSMHASNGIILYIHPMGIIWIPNRRIGSLHRSKQRIYRILQSK
jgi:hypothetical protein